jgi:hypothetical protein
MLPENWDSVYPRGDYPHLDQLSIIAGFHYNHTAEGIDDDAPRVGLIWNRWKAFGAKALYGRAFRSPYPVEQVVDIPESVVGNRILPFVPVAGEQAASAQARRLGGTRLGYRNERIPSTPTSDFALNLALRLPERPPRP